MKLSTLFMIFTLFSCAHQPTELSPGTFCKEGETKEGFLSWQVYGNDSCQKGIQTCLNGYWSGPYTHERCESVSKPCDGKPHGTVETGYLSPTTTSGFPCPSVMRTCFNGNWTGPQVWQHCNEI